METLTNRKNKENGENRKIIKSFTKSESPYKSQTFGTPLSLRVDEAVGTMSISPCGRDVVLASRKGLYIIDLDDPFSPPRWIQHVTPWEVADVQWSPHASKYMWIISTANQKALLWNLLLPPGKQVEHVLHAHSRAITDINFHAKDPNKLATCAVDSFVHCWDLRTPQKPVLSFGDWVAAATQVKWNRINPHIIASTHDRFVHVWDERMGALPLSTIQAHSTKIYGLDFSRTNECELITCSLDRTIKSWNYQSFLNSNYKKDHSISLLTDMKNLNTISKPIWQIKTDFPVWRARHTPFGTGCLILPQRGGNNSLFLIDTSKFSPNSSYTLDPLATFQGHTDQVREFLWRFRGGEGNIDDRDFQLVTWSNDHDLRLWPINKSIYSQVHFARNKPFINTNTRKGAPYISFRKQFTNNDKILNSNNKKLNTASKTMTRYRTADVSLSHLAHLDWLAGVRMGRAAFGPPAYDSPMYFESLEASNVPENLGEEVSIVGHKFPLVKFEKISVSTGDVAVSLHGPWNKTSSPESSKLLTEHDKKDEVQTNSNAISKSDDEKFKPPPSPLLRSAKVNIKSPAIIPTILDDFVEQSNISALQVNPPITLNSSSTQSNFNPSNGSEDLLFIRAYIHFPRGYPKNGHPARFKIEQTSEMPNSTLEEIQNGLLEITKKFSQHGKYCLETCLRFLLGDKISLEELFYEDEIEHDEISNIPTRKSSISSLSNEKDWSSLPRTDELEFSSESEDEEIESEDKSTTLKKTNTDPMSNISVPIPKACGAIWAANGMLVCFFPLKSDDRSNLSFIDSRKLGRNNRQTHGLDALGKLHWRGKDNYGDGRDNISASKGSISSNGKIGSGRLYPISNTNNQIIQKGNEPHSDDGNSIELEDSGEEGYSSDDSMEDLNLFANWKLAGYLKTSSGLINRGPRNKEFHGKSHGNELQNSRVNYSHHSGTATNNDATPIMRGQPDELRQRISHGSTQRNYVSIHDFRHLIPSKRELATDYILFANDPSEISVYNGQISEKYGYNDLANIWKLVSLILNRDARLEEVYVNWSPKHSILIVAKQASLITQKKDALQPDLKTSPLIYGRVTWGAHPFGSWLVSKLFEHFENEKNIQMLAILSCVFFEPDTSDMGTSSITKKYDNDIPRPIITKMAAFNFPYYRNMDVAYKFLNSNKKLMSNPFHNDKDWGGYLSKNHSAEILVGSYQSQESGFERSKRGSFSPSPREPSSFSRKKSVIFGKFSLYGSSPKRSIGLFFEDNQKSGCNTGTSNISFNNYNNNGSNNNNNSTNNNNNNNNNNNGKTTLSGNQSSNSLINAVTNISSYGDDDLRSIECITPDVSVEMCEVDSFDDAAVAKVPLLDPKKYEVYKHYRNEYASMLFLWLCPIRRLEVLHFNSIEHTPVGYMGTTYKNSFLAEADTSKHDGLIVDLVCNYCGSTIKSQKGIHKGNHCSSCRKYFIGPKCCYCRLVIKGLYSTCIICGHMCHSKCSRIWWSDENTECPSGCGCNCMIQNWDSQWGSEDDK